MRVCLSRRKQTNPRRTEQMSAMVCDDKHYNSLAWAVWSRVLGNRSILVGSAREKLRTEEEIDRWIDTLRDLNHITYALKYPTHGERYEPTQRDRREGYVQLSDAGLYKALSCMLYQIELEQLDGIRPMTVEEIRAHQWAEEVQRVSASRIAMGVADAEGAASGGFRGLRGKS